MTNACPCAPRDEKKKKKRNKQTDPRGEDKKQQKLRI